MKWSDIAIISPALKVLGLFAAIALYYTVSAQTILNFTVAVGQSFTFSAGGSFTYTDVDGRSVSFTVPANFYTENLELRIVSRLSSETSPSKPAPSGKSFAERVYELNFFKTNGTLVTVLDQPVSMTITYINADISDLVESSLAPYLWNGSSWSLLTGAVNDADNNKITFSSSSFGTFAVFATEEESPAPPPPSSGGGGGGGGGSSYSASSMSAVFKGRAYPGSTVTLLKDAQVAATTIAGQNSMFSINLGGLSGGNYIFSLYSEDKKGIRSSLLTFPVSVTSGTTAEVTGIFIAPTIATDKSEVRRGDNLVIFGQSAPLSEVTVSVNSEEEFFIKKIADATGAYLLNFDTSVLEMGEHQTKSKSALNGEITAFGKVLGFTVGTKNVAAELPKAAIKGDLNGDGRVNLVDFSVAAYWYKRVLGASFVSKEKDHLNADGKVDLVDFSIIAFHWTG